jgi:signal transduction histidine kinase
MFVTFLGVVIYFLSLLFATHPWIEKRKHKIIILASLLMGSGWASMQTLTYITYGIITPQSLTAIILILGLQSAFFVLFSIDSKSFLAFSIPCFAITGIGMLFVARSAQDISLVLMTYIYNTVLIISAAQIRRRYLDSIQNELLISQERDKMSALMNSFPGIVSLINDKLEYVMVNSFGQKLFRGVDIIGKPVGFMDPTETFPKLIREFIQTDKLSTTTEAELITPDGRHATVMTITRLPHPSQWLVVVTLIVDELIQARKNAEEQREKANYTARLASLGEMAQGVAHEINNPLSVVMFSAEELHSRLQHNQLDLEVFKNFTQKIIKMSQRIAKIVKALRYFSRDAENDPIRSIPVGMILDKAIDFRTERCRNHGILLEVDPYDEALMIKCREVQMMQVLINLLNNAYDAVVDRPDPWIKLHIREVDEFVVVEVQNSGQGIDPKLAEKIFEPFFSTKDVDKGSGLGLSISLGLMQTNGGDLKLTQCSPATFKMYIPRSRETST